jgi:hypothetical protein
MTDSEIVKALECCIEFDCKKCSYDYWDCGDKMLADTLDLINRLQARVDDLERNDLPRCKDALRRANEMGIELQAENERLDKEVDRLSQVVLYNDGVTEMKVAEAKAEAYKEFAERFNKEAEKVEIDREGDFVESDNKIYDTVANWCKATSDNLLKELVGDSNVY